MVPGVLIMTIWFSAMISSASIVMDRELGLLRETIVAPVRRSSIVLGECLGGTTTAAIQGLTLLVFPTIFLSGALYPISGLPTWLGVLNRLNPLTYAALSDRPSCANGSSEVVRFIA